MTTNRIVLKRLWAKNFRSINAMGQELIYQTGTNLIGSLENGAGKSSLLVYALFYVLFDANYKKGDNKSALIYSRSNKDCVVEVEFDVNGSSWKVVRGMKPTLFEIYKDGVKIEDEASLKDYGENIHKVLGMDQKVFCNTVVLASDKFVPFVSMSAADRRSYGEQMLDLVFISKMNDLNKEAIKILNVEMAQIQTKMNNKEVEIKNLNNIISLKKQQAADVTADLDSQISQISDQVRILSADKVLATSVQNEAKIDFETLKIQRDTIETARNRRSHLQAMISGFQTKIDQHEAVKQATISGIDSHISSLQTQLDNSCLGDCPHCKQKMPEQTLIDARQRLVSQITIKKIEKESQEKEFDNKLTGYQEGLTKATSALALIDPTLDEQIVDINGKYNIAYQKLNDSKTALAVVDSNIRNVIQQLTTLKAKKEAAGKLTGWEVEENKIKQIQEELDKFTDDLNIMQVKMKGHEINAVMLKDDGVKAQMVDQYLPFLNQCINDYLQKMNMFIHIQVNNEFEIEMIAPDRKGQSISSLSSGQQTRLNLAILLSWRKIAQAASSCDTNILIMDEVLEALSLMGIVDFMEMWQAEQNDNIGLYVISQRISEIKELFDNLIIYKLVDGDTVLAKDE